MKRSKKILLGILLSIVCLFLTTGCFNEEQHTAKGSSWFVETTEPSDNYLAEVGDMYLNSTTNDLYQKTEDGWIKVGSLGGSNSTQTEQFQAPTISEDGYWIINGEKTNHKAVAEEDKDGEDGKNTSVSIGKNGNWYINGKDTGIKAAGKDGQDGKPGKPGTNGTNGTDGKDGTSVYVAYNGYIYSGSEQTDFKVDNAIKDPSVIENTIGIEGTMSLYYKNGFLDLKDNTIALMANYMPNAKLTQYSGTKVTEISVYTNKAGELSIGTAKVSDVVNARTTGNAYTVNTKKYTVTKGLNNITLDLTVADDETIVMGGNNSVGLFYATGIDVDDEQGVFTLVDSKAHNYLISSTNDIKDKLAIKVKVDFSLGVNQIFPNVTSEFTNFGTAKQYSLAVAPFVYLKSGSLLSNKRITKIGFPIIKVSALNDNQYFTVQKVVMNSDWVTSRKGTLSTQYKVNIPLSALGNPSSTTINKWVYVDVSDLNIILGENETLGFGNNGDSVSMAYWEIPVDNQKYGFTYSFSATTAGGTTSYDHSIPMDLYYEGTTTFEEHLENLKEKDTEAIRTNELLKLQNVLKNKNVSFLGDSISTFQGYSNDATNTNSTIGSNAIYYNGSNYGMTNVNDTWWKQVATMSGMNVLVNNSWSGDRVSQKGQTRNVQLHDDTGANAGTNPDVIVVYLGINDYDNGVAVSSFETSYDAMIKAMVEKYTDADVFLMNFIPNGANSRPTTDMEAYNKVLEDIADKYGCTIVDLYNDSGITTSNKAEYMGDSVALHPNVKGMTAMADTVINTMLAKYVNIVSLVNSEATATDITATAVLAINPNDVENPNTSTNLLKIVTVMLIIITLGIFYKTKTSLRVGRYDN